MNSFSSEAIFQKFELLPESAKREVADFIDFLTQRRPRKKKKIDKQKLLDIPQWTDEDIKPIEEAGQEINKWQIETFN